MKKNQKNILSYSISEKAQISKQNSLKIAISNFLVMVVEHSNKHFCKLNKISKKLLENHIALLFHRRYSKSHRVAISSKYSKSHRVAISPKLLKITSRCYFIEVLEITSRCYFTEVTGNHIALLFQRSYLKISLRCYFQPNRTLFAGFEF